MNSIPNKEHQDQLETACLYALQSLTAGESRAFEQHASDCEVCREELAGLRPAIDAFVAWETDVLRPPESLWNRLSTRIAMESGMKAVRAVEAPSKPEWEEVAEGISCKILSLDSERGLVTMLVRLAPGGEYPPHRHMDIEELHLLHGELMIDDKKLYPGDFIRAEADSVDHRVWSETGCTCVLLTSTHDRIL